ncbi:TD and POZ domain-containing protein 3 [Caerostris darwini]|uniref:TD and POZ domain-containing protein 3 n=2 Tax=Caerostris darwini TaxID=1538125 RepID=A0AAV4W0D4_9ARAC|nr:TD and POZ domain-containing protein 3 [Caerostris darwini]
MKDKLNKCLEVCDVDTDTLERMIKYMYCDVVEDIGWKDACLLYVAAHTYAIYSLKQKCSMILRESCCLSNVCEIIKHAYNYEDEYLKTFTKQYITGHYREIKEANEWKLLVAAKEKLVLDIVVPLLNTHI